MTWFGAGTLLLGLCLIPACTLSFDTTRVRAHPDGGSGASGVAGADAGTGSGGTSSGGAGGAASGGTASGGTASGGTASGGGGGSGGGGASPVTWRQVALGKLDVVAVSSVTTATQLSGVAGDLYLAFVSVKPSKPVSSVTGLGLSWKLVREQCSGRGTARFAAFWARAGSPSSGVVTATLNGGQAFLGSAVIAVHRFSGGRAVGNVSWATTTGVDGDPPCSGGTDTNVYAWSALDTSGSNSLVVAGVHTALFSHTPGAGYTDLSDDQSGSTSDSTGVAVESRPIAVPTSNVQVSGSFSGKPDWVAIAVEILD